MRKRAEPIPTSDSEAEERRFWESHDSTKHGDWSRAERVRLPNLRPSTRSISLRAVSLLERIKVAAHTGADLDAAAHVRGRLVPKAIRSEPA